MSIAPKTLGSELSLADPDTLPDALRQVDLGNMLKIKSYDSGVISGTDHVVLPEAALFVHSARIVSATTASKVGTYLVTPDLGVTKLTAGTSGAVGIATLGADGKTITFEATDATQVVVEYVAAPATALTALFERV